jgi:hypothetical protein
MTMVQLFTRDGLLIDTVLIPKPAEIVSWKGKYYAFFHGRYVESECVRGVEEYQKMPGGFVEFLA